jgi:hypothetical protein
LTSALIMTIRLCSQALSSNCSRWKNTDQNHSET